MITDSNDLIKFVNYDEESGNCEIEIHESLYPLLIKDAEEHEMSIQEYITYLLKQKIDSIKQ